MRQAKLVEHLDSFFQVTKFDESQSWEFAIQETYRPALQRYAAPSFLNGAWNGLMLDHAEQCERVYLAVFPSQPVLDKAIAREIERGAPGALIFSHHIGPYDPADGFSMIPEAQLADLRENRISLYVCHTPLDCHPDISTGGALATALRLKEQQRFAPYLNGLTGVWGMVTPVPLQAFAQRLAKVCEMPALRYDQVCHNGLMVERVAVLPGGGDDPDVIAEAQTLGCDTYVTGQWWPYADSAWAEQQRAILSDFIPCTQINLLGSSHYGSELVVMRDRLTDWFRNLGVETQLLREPANESPA